MSITQSINTLVTTFDTWLPHQVSNASDDLALLWLSSLPSFNASQRSTANSEPELDPNWTQSVRILHRLPVHVERAFAEILQAIEQCQPNYVVVCGMAESRTRLNLEARAMQRATAVLSSDSSFGGEKSDGYPGRRESEVYWTPISLTELCSLRKSLRRTGISYDAGTFVCNETYYCLLKHHSETPNFPKPLFLHVPPLTSENRSDLLRDFQRILQHLTAP